MAFARVQGNSATSTSVSTSISVSFAAPPTVGNAVVVVVAGQRPVTVTDNQGNTYELSAIRQQSGGITATTGIHICPILVATGSPFTVTATLGGPNLSVTAGGLSIAIIEVSGVNFALKLDKTMGTQGFSVTPSSGATAVLTASEVFVVAAFTTGSTSPSIVVDSTTPTWTVERETLTTPSGEINTRIVGSAAGTTQNVTWTMGGGSNNWYALIAAYTIVTVAPEPQVTQYSVETLSLPLTVDARVTQYSVEILSDATFVPPVVTESTQFFVIMP